MHSNIITTVAITRRESQHHLPHNTTRASAKKERVGVGKESKYQNRERKKKEREIKNVKWQACTNRLIHSLSLKAYPLLKIKNVFGHKPFRPIPSKWIISIAGSYCEVTHVEEVVPSLALVP